DIDSEYLPAIFQTGVVLLSTGNVQTAAQKFEAVIRSDPESPLAKEAQKQLDEIRKQNLKDVHKPQSRSTAH
ncbi:MAG: hypothetical protein FJY85_20225, partial [Deltaproteobacteria bacterium]|nr:hypothetical protein [Deltaproteobacteria bacterium]